MQRSLWPREHGAYAQLAAPLAAALAARVPTLPGTLLAVAACAGFLAHEPLLVVLGHRGSRRRELDGARARFRLAITASVASLAGVVGLVLAPDALAIAGAVAAAAAFVIALAWRRAVHSLGGELAAAFALAGASAPVAIADGATLHAACVAWLAWFAGFACTVVAVHRVIARHREKPAPGAYLVIALLAAIAAALAYERAAALALPLALAATVLAVRPPPATRLRAIGVVLVIAALAADAIALATRVL